MTDTRKNTRQIILDAALDIVEAEGVKALTQPRIARRAGLRQSHLTYYFPRKADLFVALLDASHRRAEGRQGGGDASPETRLAGLFLDPGRMRFLLSILLEAGDDEQLRPALRSHAQALSRKIAGQAGRDAGDPAVIAFVDEMRGLGLRALLEGAPAADPAALVRAVAARHGLALSR